MLILICKLILNAPNSFKCQAKAKTIKRNLDAQVKCSKYTLFLNANHNAICTHPHTQKVSSVTSSQKLPHAWTKHYPQCKHTKTNDAKSLNKAKFLKVLSLRSNHHMKLIMLLLNNVIEGGMPRLHIRL